MDTYKRLLCPFCDSESDCWLTDAENLLQFACTIHGEFDIHSVAYRKIKEHPVFLQSLVNLLKNFPTEHPGHRLYIGMKGGQFYWTTVPHPKSKP